MAQLAVHTNGEDGRESEDDVDVEERLVEGVADRGGRGEQNDDHRCCPYGSPQNERIRGYFSANARPAITCNLGD